MYQHHRLVFILFTFPSLLLAPPTLRQLRCSQWPETRVVNESVGHQPAIAKPLVPLRFLNGWTRAWEQHSCIWKCWIIGLGDTVYYTECVDFKNLRCVWLLSSFFVNSLQSSLFFVETHFAMVPSSPHACPPQAVQQMCWPQGCCRCAPNRGTPDISYCLQSVCV